MSSIKNKIISVNSTLGKDRPKKNKNKTIRSNELKPAKNELSTLKTAVILIPIVIIIIIIGVLSVGFSQLSDISKPNTEDNSVSESSVNVSVVSVDSEKLLTLVSPGNPLPSGYQLDLVDYENIKVDKLILDDLDKLMKAAKKDKVSLILETGYVSYEEQNEIYNDEVRRLIARENESSARAAEDAELTVPMGNHADTQSGLSVRFSSSGSESFQDSDAYFWLIKNSYKYGFILRYPENKQEHTGLAYDPSLFRYVGVDNALKIQTIGMCLDEYIVYLNSR